MDIGDPTRNFQWAFLIIAGSLVMPVIVSFPVVFVLGVLYAIQRKRTLVPWLALFVIINQVSVWSSRMVGIDLSDDMLANYGYYSRSVSEMYAGMKGDEWYEIVFMIYNAVMPGGLNHNALLAVYLITAGLFVFILVKKAIEQDADSDLLVFALLLVICCNTFFVASQLTRQVLSIIILCAAIGYRSVALGAVAQLVHVTTAFSFSMYGLWKRAPLLSLAIVIIVVAALSAGGVSGIINTLYGYEGFGGQMALRVENSTMIRDTGVVLAQKVLMYVTVGGLFYLMTRESRILFLALAMALVEYLMLDYQLLYKRLFMIFDSCLPFVLLAYLSAATPDERISKLKPGRPALNSAVLLGMLLVSGLLMGKRLVVDSKRSDDYFRPLVKYDAGTMPVFGLMKR